jgi:hypothetical protein
MRCASIECVHVVGTVSLSGILSLYQNDGLDSSSDLYMVFVPADKDSSESRFSVCVMFVVSDLLVRRCLCRKEYYSTTCTEMGD